MSPASSLSPHRLKTPLLLGAIVAMASGAGVSVWAGAPAAAPPCSRGVRSYVSFDLSALPGPDHPITYAVSEDARFLRFDFPNEPKVKELDEGRRRVCVELAERIHSELLRSFDRRLRSLLASGRVRAFYDESIALVGRRGTRGELRETEAILGPLWEPYLRSIEKKLKARLAATERWPEYARIEVSVEAWSAEWLRLMDRQAPAAVDLSSGRIALRPQAYEPEELEIFLFHELAHLADPRSFQRLENEVYAWEQTLDFTSFLESRGETVPEVFKNVRKAVDARGLRVWVQAVIP